MRPSTAPLLTLACLLVLGACSSGGGSDSSSVFAGSRGTGSVPIPSDTRRGGREGLPATPKDQTPAEVAAARQRALDAAEAAWKQAEALEPRDPEGAGDRYKDLADDYPISPRAGEARFRAGRAYLRAGENRQAAEALESYLQVAPANPHLAETEELLYKAGTAYLAEGGGLLGVFKSDEPGYRILEYAATSFPNGRYADDALLALGNAYAAEDDKDDWVLAVKAYRRLLLEHPDSELVPAARLSLGAVYLRRDQGAAYHGGYVDVDPRERLPDDAQAQANAGPVLSAPELALEQYETLLLAEPRAGAATPSASQLAAAERGAADARARLAAKNLRIGGWYGGRSAPAAAAYYRAASKSTGTAADAGAPSAPATPPAVTQPTLVTPRVPGPPAPQPVAQPPVVQPPVVQPPVVQPPLVQPPVVQPPTPARPPPPPLSVPPTVPPSGATPGALPPPAVRRVPAGASSSLR